MNSTPNLRKRLSRVFCVLSFFLPLILIGQAPAFADTPGYSINSATPQSDGIHWSITGPSGWANSNPQLGWQGLKNGVVSPTHTFGSLPFYCSNTTTCTFTDPNWTSNDATSVYSACLYSQSGNVALASWGPALSPCSGAVHYCASSDIIAPAGSFTPDSTGTSGTLDIRFSWTLGTPPVPSSFSYWTVTMPGGFSQNMTKTGSTVDGSPNVYFHEWTGVTAPTAMTATITAPDISGNLGCTVTINLSNNKISQTPPDTTTGATGDATNSSNGNCGFSLNPFHYLKCLFEPTDTMQRWHDFANTAQTHPPISVIVGGYSFVTSTFSAFTSNIQGTTTCATQGVTCPTVNGNEAGTFEDPTGINAGAHRTDIIAAAGDDVQNTTWGGATYKMLEYMFVLGTFIGIWRMVSHSFGGKGSAD